MIFADMPYKRPDFDTFFAELRQEVLRFKAAKTATEQFDIYKKAYDMTVEYESQYSLARIRLNLNGSDEFYKEEVNRFILASQTYRSIFSELDSAVFDSLNFLELRELIGEVAISHFELTSKSFSPKIATYLQEEAALVLEYTRLIAGLSVEFDGKAMPLSGLAPYKDHLDRSVRIRAYTAEGECYAAQKPRFDEIFHNLVQLRTKQAQILGFNNYIELSYTKNGRSSSDMESVKTFRQEVLRHVVPHVKTIKQWRSRRLGLPKLRYYDSQVAFGDGPVRPIVSGEDIMLASEKMYTEMSPQTAEFINSLIQNKLYDIQPRVGKNPGGFCSFIHKYSAPFILANFSGSAIDVYVLTHEMGHAFARYMRAKNNKNPFSPLPMEVSEIHSMSMEFLTDPWYELFFGEQAAKYRISHAENALMLLPYACLVDEFQEQVYLNPDMTPNQRDRLWTRLEERFCPDSDYEDLPFFSQGAVWQRQTHIYKSPFYYIEYALAQTVALQFWEIHNSDPQRALQLYMDLIAHGNTKKFGQLIDSVGLKSPLTIGNIGPIIDKIMSYLSSSQI